MSSPFPCGTPSTTSTRTTSASSLSAIRSAQFAPTFPAPTTVTFFRKAKLLFERGIEKLDYNSGPAGESEGDSRNSAPNVTQTPQKSRAAAIIGNNKYAL